MRFLLFACVLAFTLPVHAGEEILRTPQSTQSEQRVQLITDQERGVLSIQIDGELVAFFTKDGLHVVKNIEYGGFISDSGTKNTIAIFEKLENKRRERR